MTTKGIKRTPWTEQELAIVKANYVALGPRATQRLIPNRSYDAVREAGMRLGLQIPGRGGNTLKWTAEQDSLLRLYYPANGGDFVAALIGDGKTRTCVNRRAYVLGIRRQVRAVDDNEIDPPIRQSIIPAGLWKANHIPAVRSVFDLAEAA